MADEQSGNTKIKWRRALLRITSITLFLGLVLLLVTPWVIAHTGLRDRLINAIIGTPDLSATSHRASFEWFSPLAIEELEINGKHHRLHIELKSIKAEHTWPRLLASTSDLGTFIVEEPRIKMLLPLDASGTPTRILSPSFTAVVNNAGLLVQIPELKDPVIDIDEIDLTLHVAGVDEDRVLTIDPLEVFTKRELTPRVCRGLLQLMNPALRDAAKVKGEYSLSLTNLKVPIGLEPDEIVEQIEMKGELELHQVSMETQNSMLLALTKVLADVYGKAAPKTIRVAKDSLIQFEMRGGRLVHEGLHFGFPDIDPLLLVSSWGSVGIDESLDLHVEVPRLDTVKRKEKGPVHCHITGTISHPRISAKDASLIVHFPNRPDAFIDVDGIDLVMNVEGSPDGQMLVFDPIDVFKREKLNRKLASSLVQLIDPDTKYSPELTGEISMSLDKLRIPLELPEEEWLDGLEIQGTLTVHEATAVANGPIRQAMVKLLSDLYGKKSAQVVRVVNDAEIDFELRNGRMYHDGLCFGCPEIDPALLVRSHGSVGLDETLDLHLELPRLDQAKSIFKGPVFCHVTGTVSNPKLSVENASLVIRMPNSDQPILNVDGIGVTMEIEVEHDQHILVFAPVTIFDKKKLTPAMSDELLRLVAPSLGDVAELQGEVSLMLDTLRVPLEDSKEDIANHLKLVGRIKLHEVSTKVETPILTAIVKVLADQYGKTPPRVVRIAKDSEIQFEVREGRLFHEGLNVGFPDISPELMINSQGSIGLDGSLDLTLEVPRILAKGAEARADKGDGKTGRMKMKITGTFDAPTIEEMNE